MFTLLVACLPLCCLLLGVQDAHAFWFPEQSSTVAVDSDWLFYFILYISLFFLVLIAALLCVFAWKYRRRPGVRAQKTSSHDIRLELTWTIIPGIIALTIAYLGISGYIDMRTPPRNAREVIATGQKWYWSFQYPNGVVDTELHVPVDEPTRLVLRSEDVLHSFFVPAFRTKMDVVPGRYNKMWFTPTKVGTYQVMCTEYCGKGHSEMLTKLIVHPADEYDQFLEDQKNKNSNKDPVALGGELYHKRACVTCHSIDGSRIIGPSFKGLYGRQEKLEGGKTVVADEDYIHESIIEPMAKIVLGYPAVMPSYKGQLKDVEIAALIAYIKTLK